MRSWCAAVLCAIVTPAQAFRQEEDLWVALRPDEAAKSAGPGCGCSLADCCPPDDDNNEYRTYKGIHKLLTKNDHSYEETRDASHWSPACSLLGLASNMGEGNGVCGKDSHDVSDIGEALQLHPPLTSRPLVGVLVEPGSCVSLYQDACWQHTYGKTGKTRWSNELYYENKNSCYGTTTPLTWLTSCNREAPFGLRIRAEWNKQLPENCDPAAKFELDEVLSNGTWTEASKPGLPRWYCMDVPDGDEYRVLVYSFGPPPCMPETSTVGPKTTDSPPQTNSTPDHNPEVETNATNSSDVKPKPQAKSESKDAARLGGFIAPATLFLSLT